MFNNQDTIDLSHGAGGRGMAKLIDQIFIDAFANPWLMQKNDQACINLPGQRIAMSTDSYVISPVFFPGGNIGSLAVNGTVNDLAMAGAKPLYLSVGFILEEGFPINHLQQIALAMAEAARQAGVAIVTGDTKVVERGKGDGIFINTTGIGVLSQTQPLKPENIRPGDKIIVSGNLGDHGITILSLRENLSFHTTLSSDTAPLHDLVNSMLAAVPAIRCLRDPTRGGLAATLNEWTQQAKLGFFIDEAMLPIRQEVLGACELLGLDPLYVANEGKLVAVCPADAADTLLATMHTHPLGQQAAIIGKAIADPHHLVQMRSTLGGMRTVDWLLGEQLPRIC